MSTRAEIEAELEIVKGKVADLLANPRPNYSVGDTKMDWGSYLESLNKIRWELETKVRAYPSERWDSFDITTDQYGHDKADYHEG